MANQDWQPRLAGIVTPPPVFVCSVEPDSASGYPVHLHAFLLSSFYFLLSSFYYLLSLERYEPMLNALKIVQKEDPSFHCEPASETGQFLLSGMGELHLDIISNRLATHFKTPHKLGSI